jgi:apolipoprotein D and lipocalin family protein
VATSATYTVLPGGKTVEVVNRCRSGSLDGPERSIKGKARVVDEETNARLKVTFFWPFSGDYWIIDLGPEYEYAVVASPDRKYLWILSRTPRMGGEVYDRILETVRAQHFDPSRLERTPQPGA